MIPVLLVIGGTGFIGHHIAIKGISEGFKVYSISRKKPENIRFVEGVEYHYLDLLDIKRLKNFLKSKSINYVVNTVGYIDHTLFKDGGDYVFENHFITTKNLLESLNKKYLKCFVHLGSSDEYGDNQSPQNEEQRESPISPYSLAKVSSCHLLQMLYKTEKFPAVILRLFLVYGPNQNEKRFLPYLIKNSLRDNKFSVTLGEQIRDYCYVKDVINAIFLTFKTKSVLGNVINIASGNPIKIRKVIETVIDIVGKGKPSFGDVKYRFNESMSLYANIAKAKKLLNWEPQYSLGKGLSETIDWISLNEK